jgi:hypothetical protein
MTDTITTPEAVLLVRGTRARLTRDSLDQTTGIEHPKGFEFIIDSGPAADAGAGLRTVYEGHDLTSDADVTFFALDIEAVPVVPVGARARLIRDTVNGIDKVDFAKGFEFIVDSGPVAEPHGVFVYEGHTFDHEKDLTFRTVDVESVENHVAIPEGARARFIRDVDGHPGDRPRKKGFEFVVGEGPYHDEDTGLLFYYGHANDGYNNVVAEAVDIELAASLADIAKEPKEFTIVSTVTIEYTHRVFAHSAAEAIKQLTDGDITEGWDERGAPQVTIEPQDVAEKGYDY